MKKDIQRVMVELERELWRQVGIAAAARETTRREVVIEALGKWLEKNNEKHPETP